MHLPEEAPPLNPWPFIIGDTVLVVTACLIASQAQAPLTGAPLIAVAGCVALGAVLAIIPFILNHTRRQDLALADRQREIAALAQTTANSAEQISIAASNLHGIAENTARALKFGETLPHKLQDKINDFKTQLNEVAVTENESLAQEINTLRASETERLETALGALRKMAVDLTALEATNRKHLAELNSSLARFSADAGRSAAEAARLIESTRAAAEKSLAAAQAASLSSIKDTVREALTDIERKFSTLSSKLAAPGHTTTEAAISPEPPSTKSTSRAPFQKSTVREEAVPHAPAPELPAATQPGLEAPPAASSTDSEASTANEPAAEDVATAVMEPEKPSRKRLPRKPATPDNELTLGFEIPSNEFSQVSPDENTPAVSADGLTRLLVTAYIGIGNKLFVRGEGPGLNWERGVPLQFVSIGKWRWESADAMEPVQLKLYKNDEVECLAVGTVTVAPGHQREITASFH